MAESAEMRRRKTPALDSYQWEWFNRAEQVRHFPIARTQWVGMSQHEVVLIQRRIGRY